MRGWRKKKKRDANGYFSYFRTPEIHSLLGHSVYHAGSYGKGRNNCKCLNMSSLNGESYGLPSFPSNPAPRLKKDLTNKKGYGRKK